jgi:hypothetical protein
VAGSGVAGWGSWERLPAPVTEIRHGTLLVCCRRTVIREGPTLIFPNGFDPRGVIFGADRIQEGPLYLVRNPLQVLTADENGVDDVVAFLTDGISGASSSVRMDEEKRESVKLCWRDFGANRSQGQRWG